MAPEAGFEGVVTWDVHVRDSSEASLITRVGRSDMRRSHVLVEITCSSCGKRFQVTPSRARNGAKFCSKRCHDIGLQKDPGDFTCAGCGEEKTADDFYTDNHAPRGRVARCKDCYRAKQKNVINFKPYRREGAYKRDAIKRGLTYELTREQFMAFWRRPCSYCGDEIQTIGLDRVNNSIGYVDGNVVPCCRICNAMKSSMSAAEFVDRCRRIAERATTAEAVGEF